MWGFGFRPKNTGFRVAMLMSPVVLATVVPLFAFLMSGEGYYFDCRAQGFGGHSYKLRLVALNPKS